MKLLSEKAKEFILLWCWIFFLAVLRSYIKAIKTIPCRHSFNNVSAAVFTSLRLDSKSVLCSAWTGVTVDKTVLKKQNHPKLLNVHVFKIFVVIWSLLVPRKATSLGMGSVFQFFLCFTPLKRMRKFCVTSVLDFSHDFILQMATKCEWEQEATKHKLLKAFHLNAFRTWNLQLSSCQVN